MDISPEAVSRIDALEAELADAYALINTQDNMLTHSYTQHTIEVAELRAQLQLALAQNAMMMSDRTYASTD